MQKWQNQSKCPCAPGLAQGIVLDLGPDHPREGAIVVERGANCKVQGLSAVICAKIAELVDLPFALWTLAGQRKHMFSRICQVVPVCPYERALHLVNTAEPSICSGDAALSNYFDHLFCC